MSTSAVLSFMQSHNRPFCANDLVSHIKDSSKSSIQKALDSLEGSGKIFMKISEKHKAYCIVQNKTENTQELLKKNKERESLAAAVDKNRRQVEEILQSRQAELAKLKKSASTPELHKQYCELKLSTEALQAKLGKMLGFTPSEDLLAKKKEAEKRLESYRRVYSKRKILCSDVMDSILENYPGKKAKFYEEVGIEPKVVT